MAQAGVILDKDQFNCSICLDTLKNPVTIPCGHNYCFNCIREHWNQNDILGVFACPQCRQNFNPRPTLARNTMLADVVERFKTVGLNGDVIESFAEADDVECDVCTGRKNKAVKSCLVCLASYCDLHVQPHYESAAFKKHKLVTASKQLQETICPIHDKLLEVFCRSDNQCICYLCLADEHKGHDTVRAEEEVQHRLGQLSDMQQTCQLQIDYREKQSEELKQAIVSLSRCARGAIEKSDAVFTGLIRSIELKRFEVKELILAQEKTAIAQTEQLLSLIHKEIAELKKTTAELNRCSYTEDHIPFLQSYQSLPAPPALSPPLSYRQHSDLPIGALMDAVSDFKGLLEEVCQGGFSNIYEKDISPRNIECNRNPFISEGFVPMFALSQTGTRPSTVFRQKNLQRRSHSRRK
uniref:FinTRIM family, member 67 n=1 Tax=Cynoglossus semilaevis TaxID=244447 RepID=A0A3P8W3K9_CYNSE